MRKRIVFVLICIFMFSGISYADDNFTNNTLVTEFINMMVEKHGFESRELEDYFAQAKYVPSSVSVMDKPAEALDWTTYMGRIITKARLKSGFAYYRKHKVTLLEAQKTYNVPAHIIAGIIGLETNFGQIKMRYRAFDTLATLAFFYPRRADFFKSELKELLIFARAEKDDPFSFVSSYAGAVGIPQFMPSNIKKFAVDGDKDGKIDIINNHNDAIFSVANYLNKHGWKKGFPVAEKVKVKGSKYVELISTRPCSGKMSNVGELSSAGVIFPYKMSPKFAASLITIESMDGKLGYYTVFTNFCTIYKYNPSLRYVMAVNNLGNYIAKNETPVKKKPVKKTTKPNKK